MSNFVDNPDGTITLKECTFKPVTPEERAAHRAEMLAFWGKHDPDIAALYAERFAREDDLDAARARLDAALHERTAVHA